jgi:REP element-mobilizing transposase RayT
MEIPDLHTAYDIDRFVVMPNHIHGILAHATSEPTALSTVVGLFKSRTSRSAGLPLWQRSYHDRVIRNDRELVAYREYIETNPLRWAHDRENPNRSSAAARAGRGPAPTPARGPTL